MWNFRWGPWESWVSQFDWKGDCTIRNVFIWKIMTNHRALVHTIAYSSFQTNLLPTSTTFNSGNPRESRPTFFWRKQAVSWWLSLSFSDYMDFFETMLPRNPLVIIFPIVHWPQMGCLATVADGGSPPSWPSDRTTLQHIATACATLHFQRLYYTFEYIMLFLFLTLGGDITSFVHLFALLVSHFLVTSSLPRIMFPMS